MGDISIGDTVLVQMTVLDVDDYSDYYYVRFQETATGQWVDAEYVQPLSGKVGHWMQRPGSMFITCDCCYCSFVENGQGWEYCPKCGAKMEEGSEEP